MVWSLRANVIFFNVKFLTWIFVLAKFEVRVSILFIYFESGLAAPLRRCSAAASTVHELDE